MNTIKLQKFNENKKRFTKQPKIHDTFLFSVSSNYYLITTYCLIFNCCYLFLDFLFGRTVSTVIIASLGISTYLT